MSDQDANMLNSRMALAGRLRTFMLSALNNLILAKPAHVSDRSAGILLTLIVLIALAIKLVGLSLHPLWPDAGYTHTMTEYSWGTLLTTPLDSHPPGYYMIAKLFHAVGEGEAWLRMPSVVSAVLSIGVMFLIGRQISGNLCGLIIASLTGSSGMLDYHGQRARMYTVLFLLLSVCVYAAICLFQRLVATSVSELETKRGPDPVPAALLYTLAGIAALNTQTAAVFMLAALGFVSLPFMWQAYRNNRFSVIALWLGAQILMALAWLPWLLNLGSVMGSGQVAWIDQPSPPAAFTLLMNLYASWILPIYVDLIFLALLGLGTVVVVLHKRWDVAAIALASAIFYPVIVWSFGIVQPIFIDRALIPALIGSFTVIGLALAHLRLPKAGWAGILVVVIGAQLATVVLSRAWPDRQDWRTATEVALEDADESTAIFIPEPFSYHAFRFYAEPVADRVFYSWSKSEGDVYAFTDDDFLEEHGSTPVDRLSKGRQFTDIPGDIDIIRVVDFAHHNPLADPTSDWLETRGWRQTSRQVIPSRVQLHIVDFERAN
ncbi:MAG: hypothetical protein AAF292_15670 [Pseudomonadota bacterium]